MARSVAAIGVCGMIVAGSAHGGGAATPPRVHIVAIENAPIPGGGGTYNEFGVPVMTPSGRVVFHARFLADVSPADNVGIYRGLPRGIHEVIRGTDQVGGSTAGLRATSFSSDPAVNASGEIAVRGSLQGPGVVSGNNSAVLRLNANGRGGVVQAREGQTIGFGAVGDLQANGNRPGENSISDGSLIVIAEALGGVAALMVTTPSGVFEAARQGQEGPGGPLFTSFSEAAVNAAGEFAALVETNDSNIADTIMRFNSLGFVDVIARAGQAAPGGGVFAHFDDGRVPLNNAGEVAFTADLGGTSVEDGVYIGGPGNVRAIAINGSTYTNGEGTLGSFRPRVALNDAGQVVFAAIVFGSEDIPNVSEEGLFIGDGSSIVAIARVGGPAPGGGVFNTVRSQFAINASGQVLFRSRVDRVPGSSLDDLVVVLFMREVDGSLTEIYRSGEPFEEGIGDVTDIAIAGCGFNGLNMFADADGLNDRGEAAFRIAFGSSNSAIAMYSRPCDADINGDGLVNNVDLAHLLGSWGPFPSPADLNGDGRVDSFDLSALLGAWLDGCP